MRNPIQTIISSSTESASDGLFLTSDNDRYINVFDPQNQKLVLNLIAENEVSSLSYAGASNDAALEKQILAAVTDDGTIELFMKPFVQSKDLQTTSLKARGKQMTRRADASIKIARSESSDALVAVVTASIQGPDVVVAYAEGGIIPVFERVRWLDEETGEMAFSGAKKVPKTKSSNSVLGSVSTNKMKNAGETQVDESRAVVEEGNTADGDIEMEDTKQDAASAADSEEDEEDSDKDGEIKKPDGKTDIRKKKEADKDVEMQESGTQGEQDEEDEDEEETGEASFGELLRANASEEVDVEAELDEETGMGALIPGKPNAAVHQVPSGVSLSTVLTQALKTNDSGMLESCFHTGDLAIIRTTIQRLDSSLAATLLQRLAERLSSRPGRYGHLLVWVQWTCVAHGGALAGKPELLKRMTTLFKVMDQRSSSLSSLLLLKGKLDMLDSQLALRQALRGNAEGMESDDEDNVIYVEGQEDDEDDDEDSEAETGKNAVTPRTKSIRDQAFQDEDEAMVNGVQSGMDESDNDEGSDDEEDDNEDDNVLDVEAEESAGSSDAEESPDEDEDEDEDSAASEGSIADFIADTEDEGESDIEMPSQPPPSKKAKMQGGGGVKGKKKGSSGRK